MKILLITFIFIGTFFIGCGQPDKMAFYKQDASVSKYPLAWQGLLLLPDEYLPQGALKHFNHPPYMSEYQKNNPGFIDIKKFKKVSPDHDLSSLLLWYSASFFHHNRITHYMIMEFPTEPQAKAYVERLKAPKGQKFNKILRYKSILFSFTLRDFKNNIIDKNSDTNSQAWIDTTITRIMEHL